MKRHDICAVFPKTGYFVTPRGLALKARLTSQYMEASLRVYRELRQAARDMLLEVKSAGYGKLHLEGDGEAAEIFRLTCLEQGVTVVSTPAAEVPLVCIDGARYAVRWPDDVEPEESVGRTGVG